VPQHARTGAAGGVPAHGPGGAAPVQDLAADAALTGLMAGEAPAATVARIDRTAERRTTPCGDGHLVWRLWGNGPPLVLLHGAFGSWTHWLRNIPALAARFRVIAPDMPG